MQVLVQERKKLGIPWQNPANEMHEMLIESNEWKKNFEPCAFQPYVGAIDSLWKDSGIQEAHRSRTDFELVSVLWSIYLHASIYNTKNRGALQNIHTALLS